VDLIWEQVVLTLMIRSRLVDGTPKALGWVVVGDVGQRDASWVVLADPEGNEFCILSGRVRPDS
jgi:hypothetical protein